MYWRRSLIVTLIMEILGYALSQFIYQPIIIQVYTTTRSEASVNLISIVFSLGFGWLLHFLVLWWAFRRYSSPVEKAKREGVLRAEDVIAMMNEEELAALRERLLPPSQPSV